MKASRRRGNVSFPYRTTGAGRSSVGGLLSGDVDVGITLRYEKER
jgi:hypothetical protein